MKRLLLLILFTFSVISFSQSTPYSSSEIYDDLLRLRNNVTVMYVAAHPDDENTRIISWLTHEKHVDAVYLSLTKGEGGQNLIGAEKGELLGLLREQELLEARKTDKGRQWFTRAVDFGYSKNTEDTFQHWDREQLLADVVWAIRVNRPEIIITRFHPDSNGKTHGHHTASAQLAMEAFELAADPNAYPEQLIYVETWKPRRLYYNTSWWFYGSKEAFDLADKSNMVEVEVGSYFPHLGISNNEIASKSRSKHASQGFGTALARGTETEWLELLKGTPPKNNDIFEGIDMGWKDPEFNSGINKLITSFDFKAPSKSIPELKKLLESAADNDQKAKIVDIILKSQGIYFEWTTAENSGTEGQKIDTELEITNRSSGAITYVLEDFENVIVAPNSSVTRKINYTLPSSAARHISPGNLNNFYHISPYNTGESYHKGEIYQTVQFDIGETLIQHKIALQQKTVDPSVGEKYEPFYSVPPFVLNFSKPVYMFNGTPQSVHVEVISYKPDQKAIVALKTNSGFRISPPKNFVSGNPGSSQIFTFKISPSDKLENAEITAEVNWNGKIYSSTMQTVDYDHIQRQILLSKSKVAFKNANIKIPDVNIGYIAGSGDDIPASLQQFGMKVTEIDLNSFTPENLKEFDVIILGIRAYNVQNKLKDFNKDLWEFVHGGGAVIVQYNTSRELLTEEIAPFPLKLGRNRISEENSAVKILQPEHAVFNYPNKIISADFDGWEQERGLYFADSWSKEIIPLLEGNDSGESPQQGILLTGNYGKGTYVYTGLSFFRELPAGVTGAYRLFMNLLALGEKKK